MAGSLDSQKLREWQRRMVRFEEGRRSVAEFCRREGVSAPSFYQWRKRLAERSTQAEAGGAEARKGFTPVRLVRSAGVVVHLPGGTQLCVPISDPEALRLVIEALARVDAERAGGVAC
jgi:hypothetical protein